MTIIEFNLQLNRLRETFGTKHFSPERSRMIWNETSALDVSWFSEIVAKCIREMRQAPMVQDFAEAAQEQRERSCAIEKAQHKKDNLEGFDRLCIDDEIRSHSKKILQIMFDK